MQQKLFHHIFKFSLPPSNNRFLTQRAKFYSDVDLIKNSHVKTLMFHNVPHFAATLLYIRCWSSFPKKRNFLLECSFYERERRNYFQCGKRRNFQIWDDERKRQIKVRGKVFNGCFLTVMIFKLWHQIKQKLIIKQQSDEENKLLHHCTSFSARNMKKFSFSHSIPKTPPGGKKEKNRENV